MVECNFFTFPVEKIDPEDPDHEFTYRSEKPQKEALAEMSILVNVADVIHIDMELIKLANKKQIEKFQEIKNLHEGISTGWKVEEQKDQVNYKNKSLQCESCSSNFSIPKDLFIHSMRVHHEGWSYVDETQSEKSNNFQNLDEDPKGPFECDLCT